MKCDLCGITVSSEQIMQTHLAGKAHKRRLANVETLQSFQQNTNKTSSSRTAQDSSKSKEEDEEKKDERKQISSSLVFAGPLLRCDICDVSVNSIQQLNVHYDGARHKKAAQKGQGKTTSSSFVQSLASDVDLPGSIIRVEDPHKKIAGSYKCKACDCLLNSEVQMQQVHTGKLNLSANSVYVQICAPKIVQIQLSISGIALKRNLQIIGSYLHFPGEHIFLQMSEQNISC